MSQFASWVDQYHDMADIGIIKQYEMCKKFAVATERVQTVAKCQPEDQEELQEEMGAWAKDLHIAKQKLSLLHWQDEWDTAHREAITLFVDTDLDDYVAASIVQAERVQAEWVAWQKAPPATQEASTPGTSQTLEVEVEEGTKDLIPELEKAGALSGTPLVLSSLKRGQSDQSEDEEEGISMQRKRTIATELAKPRPPPVVKACDSCKRARVVEACSKGTGIMCQCCNRLKAKCSWAARRHTSQRKNGSGGAQGN
ncbi:hypothetical protein EV363DRAFT_1299906 [Boletus edulis]|nr:hypothetical protein EV363DRAFT_1299906 [Boletus edulis]